jgi:prefoldin subunit 5
LESEQDVLAAYFSALRNDPEVKSMIDARIADLAEQTIVLERAAIVEKVGADLQSWVAGRRTELESDLKKSIEDLDKALTDDLEKRLAGLERQKRDEIDSTIGRRKDELETETAGLDAKRSAFQSEMASLRDKERELTASVRELSDREAAALEKVERLTRVGEGLGARDGGIGTALPRIGPPFAPPGREIGPGGAPEWITNCQLLTSRGKENLRKFVALLLAGEVPLLCGAQVEDFLEIAQVLVSGGRAVRLEADPTIIAFEDLWVRAGTLTATALRVAAMDAAGGE